MSLSSQISELRAVIARRLGNTFATLLKPLANLAWPPRQPTAKPDESRAPTIALNGTAKARSAEAKQTEIAEDTGTDLPPSHANPASEAPLAPNPTTVAYPLGPRITSIPKVVPEVTLTLNSVVPPLAAVQCAPTAVAAIPSAPTLQPPQASTDNAPKPLALEAAADPELDRLRARIASTEAKVVDLASRKSEMEQLLEEYAFRQYQAVGELLGEQLRLQLELHQRRAERSSRPEDKEAANAAAEAYADYERARQEPARPPAVLAENESKELTALYRAAVMRCHPDRVGETEKVRAHELFLTTQDAYQRRDLAAMRLICSQLSADAHSIPTSDGITPRERLDALLESIEDQGVELLLAIDAMQRQAEYRRARCREQWDDYFAALRDRLDDECTALRRQIARC